MWHAENIIINMSVIMSFKNKFQNAFQHILWDTRLLVIIAVITSLIGAVIMLIIGAMSVIWAVEKFPHLLSSATFEETFHMIALKIISGIDAYLVATVLLIFALGLYELFINKITIKEAKGSVPSILKVKNLEQLKENLGKVIVMILVVLFFKNALMLEYHDTKDLVFLSFGILMISLALFLSHHKSKK